MTDKTDIEALLLEMRDLAERIVECQGENSEGEEIIHLYDLSDTTFKAQNILLVLDALEAERWNVGVLEGVVARKEFDAQQRELAALRGEQGHGDTMVYMMPNVFASLVNTAWDVALEYKNAQCLRDALSRELKGYFTLTRQPKPVVVLSDCDIGAVSHMAHWYSEEQCEAWVAGVDHAKRQMQAAGIVVKDGE